jgi:predicted acylesterase/phospholipase RssA
MSPAKRRSRPVIGLALAGGGPVGGIYEVGALAALSEAIDGVDFSDLDIYVGVSSGAFVAAMLANRIGPAKLVSMMMNKDADEVFDPEILLRPAFGEYARRLRQVPALFWTSLFRYLSDPLHSGLFESFQRMSRALPSGVLDSAGVDSLLRRLFQSPGRTNDFRELKNRLFLVATDLESGASVAFGAPGLDTTPISTAVQASAALPGLFSPVEIGGHCYVDGALIKTLHASVALRAGADLLFCINPLVPFDSVLAARHPAADGDDDTPSRLLDGGLPTVLSQTFRAIIHSRMQVGMARYQHEFANADVVLFEAGRDDAAMFFTNVFSYSSRRRLCEHAYQRTRAELYRRRDELAPILERHGLRLKLSVLRDARRSLLAVSREQSLAALAGSLDASLGELERCLHERSARLS